MDQKKGLLICLICLAFFVSSCGGSNDTPTPSTPLEATEQPVTATETTQPTLTPTLAFPADYLGGELPVSGSYIPELEIFDQTMVDYMTKRGIDAAELVLIQDNEIIFSHAYGWFDEDHTRPLTTDAVMRVASVSKPITKVLIQKLIDQQKIHNYDLVFCLDGNTTDCLLPIEPIAGATVDPRMKDITVGMLLDHQGGWDREAANFDPMFGDIKIAKALGVTSPVDKYQIAQYMMGQPLDFDPGSKEVYSNYGYSLLGMIAERMTGKTYLQAIQDEIFTPLGVDNVTIAQTLPENRLANEAHYNCPGKGPSVYNPGTSVCWPDGGWNIEHMDAHGGILTSAETLGKFISNYCIGSGRTLSSSCGNWAFYGELDGTLAMIIQRSDNIKWVVILNQREDSTNGLYEDIRDVIDGLVTNIN